MFKQLHAVTADSALVVADVASLPPAPSSVEGDMRYVADVNRLYIFDGAAWIIDTGNVTGAASSTDNALARFDGATGTTLQNSTIIVGDTGNTAGFGTIDTTGVVTITVAGNAPALVLSAAGNPITFSTFAGVRLEFSTSGPFVQFYDDNAATNSTYILGRSSRHLILACDGTSAARSVKVQGSVGQTADLFVVESDDGVDKFSVDVSGNVVFAGTVDGRDVAADGAVLDTAILDGDFSVDGLMVRTGAGAYASRTITGTANQVVVVDGNGDAGNPTLSLPQSIHTAATPTFASLTLSNKLFTTAIETTAALNGGTTTTGASVLIELLSPDAATVASHTLTFPASPANGQQFYVGNAHGTNVITALTMSAGSDTILGALTALNVGDHAGYIYVVATTTWVRFS